MLSIQNNNNERSHTESPEQFPLLQKYQLTLEDFPERFRNNLKNILRDDGSMTELNLVSNDLGKIKDPKVWQAIGSALSCLNALTTLDLSWNNLDHIQDPKVWQAIGPALFHLPELTTLDLRGNLFGWIKDPKIWQDFVDAICANKTIVSLNLDDNNLPSYEMVQLQAHIEENKLCAKKRKALLEEKAYSNDEEDEKKEEKVDHVKMQRMDVTNQLIESTGKTKHAQGGFFHGIPNHAPDDKKEAEKSCHCACGIQ